MKGLRTVASPGQAQEIDDIGVREQRRMQKRMELGEDALESPAVSYRCRLAIGLKRHPCCLVHHVSGPLRSFDWLFDDPTANVSSYNNLGRARRQGLPRDRERRAMAEEQRGIDRLGLQKHGGDVQFGRIASAKRWGHQVEHVRNIGFDGKDGQ